MVYQSERITKFNHLVSCSKSKSEGRKGSEEEAYFKPSDVKIIGTSFAQNCAQTTLKIKFAILYPSVKGQPLQVARPEEVVDMVKENKEIIEKELNGTIESVTHGTTESVTPTGETTTESTTSTGTNISCMQLFSIRNVFTIFSVES